jgi:hypothetical protein
MRETGSLSTATARPAFRKEEASQAAWLRQGLLPFLPIWLAPLALLAPVWLTGKAVFWGTVSLQFIPWQAFAWESLKLGRLPLWNPLVGMGAPLAANYQSALFYPPNWLLFPLYLAGGVEWLAWGQGVLIPLHMAWAGTGMALLARRLGVGVFGQTVGGLAYGLSGYLVARSGFLSINASVAWLPWIMLAGLLLVDASPKFPHKREAFPAFSRRALFLILTVGMQLLAGHAQTAWYTLLLLGLWSAYWGWKRGVRIGPPLSNRRNIAWVGGKGAVRAWSLLALCLLLAVALSAVQLLPTAEYLLQSQRSAAVEFDFALTYSFWPARFLTLFAPDFFGNPARGDYHGYGNYWEDHLYPGLLPLLLALGGIGLGFRNLLRKREERWEHTGLVILLSALTGISFLLALGKNTPVFPWLYHHLPTFDMFQGPTRFSLWAVFALALLAAVSADRWRKPQGRVLYWTRLGTAGAFAISLGACASAFLFSGVSPAFIRAMALASLWGVGAGLLLLLAPREGFIGESGGRWRLAAILLISADLVSAGWGLNPGIDRDFYRGPAQTAAQVRELAAGGRLYLPEKDEYGLKYDRFMQFQTFDPGENWENLRAVLLPNLNLLDGIASANQFDPLVPGRYARWMETLGGEVSGEVEEQMMNLMSVSVVESIDPRAEYGVQFKTVESGARARWVPCALTVQDGEQALREVVDPGFNPLQTVILEEGRTAAGEACLAGGAGRVQILAERPDRITLQAITDRPGWLVLADIWYPGWQVSVNGKTASLLRANYLFRAVRLEPGEHRVEFIYRPASFWAGLAISLAGILFLGVWWWVGRQPGETLPV